MDADAFSRAVDDGLRLSKRIYAGKDRYATLSPARAAMERSRTSDLLPTASMVYAVFVDPTIMDNPDIPSYLPHAHGRCDPPALIPLQMKGVEVAVDCHVGVAEVAVRGRWRVHCVMGSRSCELAGGPHGRAGYLLYDVTDHRCWSSECGWHSFDNRKSGVQAIGFWWWPAAGLRKVYLFCDSWSIRDVDKDDGVNKQYDSVRTLVSMVLRSECVKNGEKVYKSSQKQTPQGQIIRAKIQIST